MTDRSRTLNLAKRSLTAVVLGGGLVAAAATPAMAQPVVTGGLVNVTVTNNNIPVVSYDNIGVGAALGVAANVCGVGVNVLATQLGNNAPVSCTSTSSGQTATITQALGR